MGAGLGGTTLGLAVGGGGGAVLVGAALVGADGAVRVGTIADGALEEPFSMVPDTVLLDGEAEPSVAVLGAAPSETR